MPKRPTSGFLPAFATPDAMRRAMTLTPTSWRRVDGRGASAGDQRCPANHFYDFVNVAAPDKPFWPILYKRLMSGYLQASGAHVRASRQYVNDRPSTTADPASVTAAFHRDGDIVTRVGIGWRDDPCLRRDRTRIPPPPGSCLLAAVPMPRFVFFSARNTQALTVDRHAASDLEHLCGHRRRGWSGRRTALR